MIASIPLFLPVFLFFSEWNFDTLGLFQNILSSPPFSRIYVQPQINVLSEIAQHGTKK